jgi:hypothetical protein
MSLRSPLSIPFCVEDSDADSQRLATGSTFSLAEDSQFDFMDEFEFCNLTTRYSSGEM